MKLSIKLPFVLAVLFCLLSFCSCSNNEPITRYYVIMVGSDVKIRGVGEFPSDEAATKKIAGEWDGKEKYCEKELAKINDETPDAYYKEKALNNILNEKWILVKITATKSFDPEEAIKTLPKIWNDREKLQAFIDKYKLSLDSWPIN